MQHVQINDENAARDFWAGQMQKHPRVHGAIAIVSSFLSYFVNGHFMVALAQWLVRVAGRVAQSSLLLATLYVTMNNVAHPFMAMLLPSGVIGVLNQLSVIAFSIIPELIVASAIQATYEHWAMFFRSATWKNGAWVWATLYTLPTVAFIAITYVTLSTFVSTVATSGVAPLATGVALTIRFLVGWSYSIIEILYTTIGKRGYVAMLDNLRAITQELRATIAQRDTELGELRTTIAQQESSIAALSATIAQRDTELGELRTTIARATPGRALRRATVQSATHSATESAIAPDSATVQSATDDSATHDYVAIDNGESIAVSDGNGATLVATGEPRERIKQAMLTALQGNEKINYKEIAQVAGAGYSTVRKHAPSIIEEIQGTQGEQNTESLAALQ